MAQTKQGGYPQQPAYPPQGDYPQGGYPPQAGHPQGGYPPQADHPQGYPPQAGYPQGGYPPQAGYPQGGYPPQAGYPQGGYPPQPGFAPPGGVTKESGYPAYPAPLSQPDPGFANLGYGEPAPNYIAQENRDSFSEDADIKGFDFNEKSIRRGFIRKVYSILMSQLAVTLGVVCLFVYHEPTQFWVLSHPELLWMALIALFVCIVAMACCDTVRRKAPMNFIFLGVFTLAESFLLGVVTTQYASHEVMMALGITAAICLALTLFALQTRYDFTAMGGVLLCILVVFVLFGLIAIFIPKNTILSLVYASVGALIFSLYLIYDTQMMMGGNHKYSISPEEYVFAALNLYLDVINIFLYILRIIGAARG